MWNAANKNARCHKLHSQLALVMQIVYYLQ